MNDFITKNDLDYCLEEINWINRNFSSRDFEEIEGDPKFEFKRKKLIILRDYFNHRYTHMIGLLKRLSKYDQSRITEHFKDWHPLVSDIVGDVIEYRGNENKENENIQELIGLLSPKEIKEWDRIEQISLTDWFQDWMRKKSFRA